ncbi:MAG: type II toxin-antitoxin system VapC family toxin [Candidatus Aenigmarchaeota archaeon]|nr:type II toxin-antitoxin system VapC family toxin [Candidatus Aenigmarchaeota archaeon]
MKLYLDADIFLALIKENDRFKAAARSFFSKSKGHELITSTLSCLEVWFYLYKHGLQEKALDSIRAISSICSVISYDPYDLENSIVLAEHHKLSPADAIHATLAMGFDAIVSSDSSFDKLSDLKRIDFTK